MVTKDEIWEWLEEVSDPEIPVLSVVDLGVVRDASFEDNSWIITITPTYSGCPAMQVMEADIKSKLKEKGIADVKVRTVLSPAWTTDWLSDKGKFKLREYGIAPPENEVTRVSFSQSIEYIENQNLKSKSFRAWCKDRFNLKTVVCLPKSITTILFNIK